MLVYEIQLNLMEFLIISLGIYDSTNGLVNNSLFVVLRVIMLYSYVNGKPPHLLPEYHEYQLTMD